MPTLNLGRVKAPPFVPRGAWDSGTAYVINDLVVGTSGDSFAAVADSTGEDPESALGSWVFFAAGGAAGADGTPGSDATVNATNVASVITGATEKTTPVDADQLAITDSAASGALKRLTFANLWAWIKGLTDTRYGGPVYVSRLTSAVNYTNDATGTAICSVTIPAGTYLMDVFARFTANSANCKIIPTITAGQSELWTGWRGSYGNGGSPARIAGSDIGTSGGGPWGATSNAENHERGGFLKISGTATYSIAASQNTSSATTTTVASGAYIIARKIG